MRRSFVAAALAAAAISLAPFGAHALAPGKGVAQLAVQDWHVKDGLPGDFVRAIAQSADGRLWVAALGGLVRYDGTRFVPVDVAPALKAMVADVTTLLVARDGSVWLGSRHHPPMRHFAGSVRTETEGLPAGTVAVAWAEDRDGRVWLVSRQGLFRFEEGRFIARAARGLEAVVPTALYFDRGNTLWLGTESGLFTLSGDQLTRAAGPKQLVTALHQDARHALWVAAAGSLTALTDGKVTATLTTRDGLPDGISQIEHDGDDNLWLASRQGLARVRARAARVELFTMKDGLPAEDVTAVYLDRERSLWLGTRNGGLAQLHDRTLDTHAGPPELQGREVLSVCEDDQGGLWFGTRTGAVRWKDGRVTRYGVADGLPGDNVITLAPGGPGEVWLGTPNGLVRWRGGKIDDPGFWRRRARVLYRDSKGSLWIGGDGELGHHSGGKLELFTPQEGIMAGHVRALGEDAAGVLWVSGIGGLVRREGARFVKATPVPGTVSGGVRAFLRDRAGAFWFTTIRNGLVRQQGGAAFAFDASVGMDPGMLFSLLEDDAGDIWIATNKSIVRVSRPSLEAVAEGRRATVQIASFESTDRRVGVVGAQLRQPGAWKARDGSLWFVTANGPLHIDPRALHSNGVLPRPSIDAVVADGRVIPDAGRPLLAARTRRLEVQFSAITLLEPRKARFRTLLEGFDAGWVEAGSRHSAVYLDLPAGDYRLRVQASNNDGVWNERAANFSFAVAAPFYRRLWFYLGCAGALLPIAWLVHRSRLARVRAQYLGMLFERARVARELHDTLLQGMSSVGLQLHALRTKFADAPGGVVRELEQVNETVTQCLQDTRRAVRGLREPPRPNADLGPALTRLVERLRTTVRPSESAQVTPIACDVRIEGAPRRLPHAVEDELYRIGQEAVTNALKHAEASHIELKLAYEPEAVRLVVADDGRGFDPAAKDKAQEHFGLRGLFERAARIGASLDVRSQAGGGTIIEARMPQ